VSPASESIPLLSWRLQNFKSIRRAELSLAPLTVLVGANSSGKTSLIQSILLVAQAAQAGNQGSAFSLNGPLVSVGRFDEVKFAHAKAESVGIGASIQLGAGIPSAEPTSLAAERTHGSRLFSSAASSTLNWWVTFDGPAVNEAGSAEIGTVEAELQPAVQLPGIGTLKLTSARRGQGPTEADLERLRLGNLALPTREEFALGFMGQLSTGDAESLPIRGLQLKAGLPMGVLTTWKLRDAAARGWVDTRIYRPYSSTSRGLRPRVRVPALKRSRTSAATISAMADLAADEIRAWHYATNPTSLRAHLERSNHPLSLEERADLRDSVDALVEAIIEKLDLAEEVFLPPDRAAVGSWNDDLQEAYRFFRERVVYLGPLRQDPQAGYQTAPVGAAGFIGRKGEFLAAVLHASRAREVMSFDEAGKSRRMVLTEAVNRWAAWLQIADEVQTTDLGRLGIQVSIRRGGVPALDLTSVGVGVSQLLPVLVMCLAAAPGSLILLEQPELHLHPGLQQKLGDFLLACARSGRQLIVETHSEYLVSRLRRLIAEDPSRELLDTIALHFVEQTDDESRFRRVSLNEFGGIEDWPIGFFDQAASESREILKAGLEKRTRLVGPG
jgi:predicted ATPase